MIESLLQLDDATATFLEWEIGIGLTGIAGVGAIMIRKLATMQDDVSRMKQFLIDKFGAKLD